MNPRRPQPARPRRLPVHPACRGMTLIEMVAVIALIAMLLTLAGLNTNTMTRSGAIRGTQTQLLGAASAARQLALTHRTESRLEARNEGDRGAYVLSVVTNGTPRTIGVTNRLPRGIRFSTASQGVVRFRADGSGGGDDRDWPRNQREILAYEFLRPVTDQRRTAIVIHRLTGYARPAPEDEP